MGIYPEVPRLYTSPSGEEWFIWLDATLADIRSLFSCNMTLTGTCLQDLTIEECIEWVAEYNRTHPDEQRGSFGFHMRTQDGKTFCLPSFMYPSNEQLYDPLYLIRSKSIYPELADVESTVFALVSETPFPPCPGNTVKYHDHVHLRCEDGNYLSFDERNNIRGVYRASFEDKKNASTLIPELGVNFLKYDPQPEYPLWDISGNISNSAGTLSMAYSKPFKLTYSASKNFTLASELLPAFYQDETKELHLSRIRHNSQWDWFLIKGLPTEKSSIIPVSLNRKKGPLLYGEEFYLVNSATNSLMGVEDGSLVNLSIILPESIWDTMMPDEFNTQLYGERADNKVYARHSKRKIQVLFSFEPVRMFATYCNDGTCEKVSLDKVNQDGTYNGELVYRSDYCWGFCPLADKDQDTSQKDASVDVSKDVSMNTPLAASNPPVSSQINVPALVITIVIAFVLVAGITILIIASRRRG